MALRRYADWKPSPEFQIPAAVLGATAGISAAVLLSVLLSLVSDWVKSRWGFGISGMVSPVALPVCAAVGHRVMRRINERRAASLRDAPDDGQFAVNATFRREVRYGFDEGLIAFVDGWLIYTGRNCSFSLRKQDVIKFATPDQQVIIDFLGPHHRHVIEFRGADTKAFAKAMREWRHGPVAEGEPIYPPVVADRSAVRLSEMTIGLGIIFGLLAIIVCLLLHKVGVRVVATVLFSSFAIGFLVIGFYMRRSFARLAHNLPLQKGFVLSPSAYRMLKDEKEHLKTLLNGSTR